MKRLVVDATTLVSGSANPHGESPPSLLYADLTGTRFELIACPNREDPKEVEAILRDPKDDYLLALARESGAEAIVSGDKHLLDHPGLEPRAINAREACELLELI